MITKDEIDDIVRKYNTRNIIIGTLGSHSALNIFKGAKEEGFGTICICKKSDEIVYQRFPLADNLITVDNFNELLDEDLQQKLRQTNTILIPHGSFNAYISPERIVDELRLPLFGNRKLLRWETEREKQMEWLQRAGLTLPKRFQDPDHIETVVIAKFPGARGGKGYFLANSPESFRKKARDIINRGHLRKEDLEEIHLQEYIIGVNVYPSYFNSPLKNE
jgi:5-formaminoimidazole-4-carboxamide-1-(beta)-D-ribofuranosyl 5'-monophosphate synthetase